MSVRELEELKRICAKRKIEQHFHFTQAPNLPRILKRGLLTRTQLELLKQEEPGFKAALNDDLRLDEQANSISISVSFPNSKLFWKFRNECRTAWAVLQLDPSLLWDYPCAFCPTNAASNACKGKHSEFMNPAAFEAMFHQQLGSRHGMPDSMPTDVQAEVLVYATIPPDRIQAVFFESKKHLEQALDWCDGFIGQQRFELSPQLFQSREIIVRSLESQRKSEVAAWLDAPFSFPSKVIHWWKKFWSSLSGTPASRKRKR